MRAWVGAAVLLCGPAGLGAEPDPAPSAERGRAALTSAGYLPPAWSLDAFEKAGALWGGEAVEPADYPAAFNRRYGLHPAPYPNDGLPMGLRRARSKDGAKVGLQLDCLVCHGGSIGGTSYVGLGNTQLDLKGLLDDLTRASGRRPPPPLFTLNTARGTNNAGQIAVVLLNWRNTDLSFRKFPLATAANLPELDTPAWWVLGKKSTKYYDGRTDVRSSRSNMQFLLGDLSLREFEDLEPTFADIDAYLKTLTPPKYPFEIDSARAESGRLVFEKTCARCHGTYGPGGTYPNEVVPLDVIGTDPARAKGLTPRFIAHYNATWFAEGYPVEEESIGYQAPPLDGVWATAPYLHNGSVPTLHHLLKSSERPKRFRRPPSTAFEHYDREKVGWTSEAAGPLDPKTPAHEARAVYDTSRWGLGNGGSHVRGQAVGGGEAGRDRVPERPFRLRRGHNGRRVPEAEPIRPSSREVAMRTFLRKCPHRLVLHFPNIIAASGLLTIGVALHGPEVEHAREMARRAVCTNNLRVHSGSCGIHVYHRPGTLNGARVCTCPTCGFFAPDFDDSSRAYRPFLFLEVDDPMAAAGGPGSRRAGDFRGNWPAFTVIGDGSMESVWIEYLFEHKDRLTSGPTRDVCFLREDQTDSVHEPHSRVIYDGLRRRGAVR